MITKASECSIRVFMRCLFDEDYDGVENWDGIWGEYVDLSGLSKAQELDLLTGIHNTQVRLLVIPEMVEFQIQYIKEFGEPYYDGFWFFKKYGHRLIWDKEDPERFMKQIDLMLIKEKKYVAVLDDLNNRLKKLHKKGVSPSEINVRREFIKTLNAVGKWRGYDVNRDSTDMETYSLMLADYFDRAGDEKTSKRN